MLLFRLYKRNSAVYRVVPSVVASVPDDENSVVKVSVDGLTVSVAAEVASLMNPSSVPREEMSVIKEVSVCWVNSVVAAVVGPSETTLLAGEEISVTKEVFVDWLDV